jgi:signal transduction histidine kinase
LHTANNTRPVATKASVAGFVAGELAVDSGHIHRAACAEWGGTLAACGNDISEADRCFAAYAAHELRSEITFQLTLAQATLTDPDADSTALREMGEELVAACWRQERLLEALLTLARSEYGHLRREPVDLAATAGEVLRAHDHHGLTSTTALEPARIAGDRQLIEHLLANLVANAIRHNNPAGRLDVATYTAAGRAILTVANTGPVIPTAEISRLFRPFERLSPYAGPRSDGAGLGLAIVQAIAKAHDAALTAQAPPGGGLRIAIDFPAKTLAKPFVVKKPGLPIRGTLTRPR